MDTVAVRTAMRCGGVSQEECEGHESCELEDQGFSIYDQGSSLPANIL